MSRAPKKRNARRYPAGRRSDHVRAVIRTALAGVACFIGSVACTGPSQQDPEPPPPPPATLEVTHIDLGSSESLAIATVLIPGGRCMLGTAIQDTTDEEYHGDESPREVTVKPFRLGRTPVTAQEFCAFLNATGLPTTAVSQLYRLDPDPPPPPARFEQSTIVWDGGRYVPREGGDKMPATRVTWLGAVRFCEWLSERSGRRFRLPTEADWECAARGTEGRMWPWLFDVNPRRLPRTLGWRWQQYGTPFRGRTWIWRI